MLKVIGVASVEELFSPIPQELRFKGKLQLPEELPEWRLRSLIEGLASRNTDATRVRSFSGAGIYNHYVPAAVAQLLLRSEFYTAYTPYQPEVSQGTLQSIFEYQTMIARLLGMEVANASMYDGSSALAEAVNMAIRIFKGRRRRVLIAGAVHPEYVAVTRTYQIDPEETLLSIPPAPDGRADLEKVEKAMSPDVAAVVVQHPNFFGLLEDLSELARISHSHSALLVVAFTEPLAFGLVKPPGEFGADIVVGEGQSFGLSMGFGGPLLGIMTTRRAYVRALPGRLVGKTTDRHGNDCYVVTLATREQHIRRERATSNICTNEGLCALAAAIYLSLLGNEGLSKLARLNHQAANYLASRLEAIRGVILPYRNTPRFNEMVVEFEIDAREIVRRMAQYGFVAGVPLGDLLPNSNNRLLVTTTEMNPRQDIDAYCAALRVCCA